MQEVSPEVSLRAYIDQDTLGITLGYLISLRTEFESETARYQDDIRVAHSVGSVFPFSFAFCLSIFEAVCTFLLKELTGPSPAASSPSSSSAAAAYPHHKL